MWLDRLEVEHANLRTALSWAIRTGETEIGLRIAGALERFWDHRGYYVEGRRWLRTLLERDGASPLVRAKALRAAGVLAIEQADFNQAAQFLTIALDLARAGGDIYGTAQALNALGSVALWRGDDAGAEGFFIAALDLMRALEDDDGTAALLAQLGYVELNSGRCDSARARFVDALAFYERVGNGIGRVKMLTLLGWALLEQGDHQAAVTILAEALHMNEAFGYHSYDAAGLEGMAAVATFRGPQDSVRAAHLFGASAAVRAVIGAPAWPGDAVRLARFVERARASLGDYAFDQARAVGQALSIEAARAETRQLVVTNSPATPGGAALTAREMDVLRLVRSGLTDREIAERCFISKRTVKNHVANAFAKLNVRTRGDAVDVAISRGLF